MKKERQLSKYIDELNKGKIPALKNNVEQDYDMLIETVKKVHLLREIEYPNELFEKQLIHSLSENDSIESSFVENDRNMNRMNTVIMEDFIVVKKSGVAHRLLRGLSYTAVIAAAGLLLAMGFNRLLPTEPTNIVYAMEKAVKEVEAYHGILEVMQINELGEAISQSTREVWANLKGEYYLEEIDGFSKGLITVNNGESKWQISPKDKQVFLFAAFPDPYHFTFELESELEEMKAATLVKEVGMELINGRKALKLEITPKGGDSYYLWLDVETELPLQKLTAMQNSIQYKMTYNFIEYIDSFPEELQTYVLPQGYEEVDLNPEQFVLTMEEAAELVGFSPVSYEVTPLDYKLEKISVDKNLSAVTLYYNHKRVEKKIAIRQSKISKDFTTNAGAVLGSIGDRNLEIVFTSQVTSLRWQEGDMEYNIYGEMQMEDLIAFAQEITDEKVSVSDVSNDSEVKPQIEVETDLEAETNEQKSVDAGHSPWKLDPVFVTQVFASLLISPEGIVGDYPIAYDDVVIIENNGVDATAEIMDNNSIAKYVYLKRLIRQDETGIWTVVGYDVVEK
ncbi:MAG: hypothetical protein K0R00_1994 [Herbinix sp.]|jgi:hypothetical protein|nr:hypothetical protein [Herbinix sp.]